MKVSRFVFNMFGVNSYVMWDPESLEAAIVDPGMIDQAEKDALDSFISRNSLWPTQLINTHSHLDHIFGNTYIKEKYGLEIKANPADDFLARTLPEQAARFGCACRSPRRVSTSNSTTAIPFTSAKNPSKSSQSPATRQAR